MKQYTDTKKRFRDKIQSELTIAPRSCHTTASRYRAGGDEGDRTPYLLNAIQALSQVSYTPTELLRYNITIFLKNQDLN